MDSPDFQQRLGKHLEERLGSQITNMQTPLQGMGSTVLLIKLDSGEEYAIKYGEPAAYDVPALELLKQKKVDVPVPKLHSHFMFENFPVVVMEKINYPLLDSIPVEQMHRYIPSMIFNLQKIHKINSDKPGTVSGTEKKSTWKEIILSKFDGSTSYLDWNEIAGRQGLEKSLILNSVQMIQELIQTTSFIDHDYSFLHTDFNQRNLFVNPNTDDITAIVDWSEALFGDPIYDFSRVRMYIWHFDLGTPTLTNYNNILSFSAEKKKLDDLYMLSRIIEYLAYYSEEIGRAHV